jgi:hypothetical protein
MGCKPMPLDQAVRIRDRYRMAETPPRSGSERQGAWGAVRLEPVLLVVRHEQGCQKCQQERLGFSYTSQSHQGRHNYVE